MTFASGGTLGSNQRKTTNQTSIAMTTSAVAEADTLVVVFVAVDNNKTPDGACVAGPPATLATDALDPGAITPGSLTSREYLWIHGLAGEGPQTDAYTWDADYTQVSGNGTTGN